MLRALPGMRLVVCLLALHLVGCSEGRPGGSGTGSADLTPVSDEGYTTTETGLKYRIIDPGGDRKPTLADVVVTHYRGKLMDGSVFQQSYGTPSAAFTLTDVNEGWREGLQLIGQGGIIELIVPPDLAYGSEGRPQGGVPPDATLYFFVELLEVRTSDSN